MVVFLVVGLAASFFTGSGAGFNLRGVVIFLATVFLETFSSLFFEGDPQNFDNDSGLDITSRIGFFLGALDALGALEVLDLVGEKYPPS